MSVLSFAAVLLVGFALGFVQAQTKTYSIANNYTGSVFFEGWDYAQGGDTKNLGSVLYQGAADAKAQNLTYINNVGNAIIKIDNTTANNSTTYGRASVQISTQAAVNQGSLILFQARHIPYGCSVWPGFRTLGANGTNWPQYGEMDIIEEVNLATFNQYSYTRRKDAPILTLRQVGCIIVENKPNNFGQGFAQNGGGAYAVLWNDDGIKFWFFPRSGIPSDFTSTSPNPANWGPPSAFYPQSTCNTTKFFGPQSLMLDLDICGRYAGAPGIFNSGNLCQGLCTNFVQNPRAKAMGQSLRLFQALLSQILRLRVRPRLCTKAMLIAAQHRSFSRHHRFGYLFL
ncbi:concanavalin A-like lectin/glucanase domain-containing protein [Cantharellus anzutake]|uniref:concanavalin A-like lectin/glucanase domain-containing protein n=1 Tax=Cantharellus anzutake TaxID=1750568 RepID=UPI001903C465|nr:concanavalin A-like lectin/glucanase domain-containing protein [Cantharellus anzutake]KAF8333125.1 concanavalin A-like lectin/glucanase domain-containing protein [Cantharellus anzutake]